MEYLPALFGLAAAALLVVILPGPNFVSIVSAATTRGRRAGLATAAGVSIGDGIWAASSLLGLAVLLDRYGWLAELVRFAGAAFLVLLGVRALLSSRRGDAGADVAGPAPAVARSTRSAFGTGLLVDLGNPKAAVFFTSLFAALLPTGAPVWVPVAAVAIATLLPGAWYTTVALLFSTARVMAGYRRVRRGLDAITGGVLVALGARLATSSG